MQRENYSAQDGNAHMCQHYFYFSYTLHGDGAKCPTKTRRYHAILRWHQVYIGGFVLNVTVIQRWLHIGFNECDLVLNLHLIKITIHCGNVHCSDAYLLTVECCMSNGIRNNCTVENSTINWLLRNRVYDSIKYAINLQLRYRCSTRPWINNTY